MGRVDPTRASRASIGFLGLAALAAAAGGCERPTVQVVRARIGTVEATATSVEAGVVKAGRDSILSIPASGRIVEVFRVKGDRVKEGDPLIRLENDLERIALEEAKVELNRVKTLGPSGATSEDIIDRARFAVERAQVHYDRTFVRAPFEGLVIELNANLGEMTYGTMPLNLVLGGKKGNAEEVLARVIDDSRIYVEADIDEADAGRLRPGQETRVTVDALGGKVLAGRLARINQAVSTAEGISRTVRVEIDLVNGGGVGTSSRGLLVGMSADIEVILDRVEGVPSVPTLTVLEGEDRKSVYTVVDGRLRERTVKVGISNWELTEVREGLREGDVVVIPTDRRKLLEGLAVATETREEEPRP
jgi:HlyD family secretion protein